MIKEAETAKLLRQAHEALGQVRLGWKLGQSVGETLRDLKEAKRILEEAEARLVRIGEEWELRQLATGNLDGDTIIAFAAGVAEAYRAHK